MRFWQKKMIKIPLGTVEYDFEAQEVIILYVVEDLRRRRGLSEAQEGIMRAISERGDYMST